MIIANIIWKLTYAHSCRPLPGGGGGDTRRYQMGIKRTTSQPTVECSVELHLRINILLLPAP